MELPPLITSLTDAAVYDHPVTETRLVETHISWVILTGRYAYKIKKPVDLGFLDFSTLEKRHFYCTEELRLNRRLAPDIYRAVIPVSGSEHAPVLGGSGQPIEYALQMVQFDQDAQFDRLLGQGVLGARHIDALAGLVAEFHAGIGVADSGTDYGSVATVCDPVAENFRQIARCTQRDQRLAVLEAWSEQACERLQAIIERRKADGFVRECHGDMHLRNLAWVNDRPLVFDCIEFNASLRWIDVISEVAFLVMDLLYRDRPDLAWRFLNTYLESGGDYPGVVMLPFYLCYRAMVRAKVEAIRARQPDTGAQELAQAWQGFERHLQLASDVTGLPAPVLIITRGVSASGKSTVTQALLEQAGAIRIRSDVERKRLFGLAPDTAVPGAVGQGIYSGQAGADTYARLAGLAGRVLDAGLSVIVDATFLDNGQVAVFRALAAGRELDFLVLEMTAPPDILRRRIRARRHDVSDAGLAVLEHQLSGWQELPEPLRAYRITVDTTGPVDTDRLARMIAQRRNNAGRPG